ncbi:MAG: hypothetical protein ACI379_06085 [Nocardioides sp.]|uniref:hypothetical protein n=1 Tax=Nocardioides sp. TaxID=35761 RepID=UPI003F067675
MTIRSDVPPVIRIAGALGLFAVALGLLAAGHFIQFDDVEGYGSDRWVRPLGYLSALTLVVSVAVAWRDDLARRLLGLSIGGLLILVGWQHASNDGFRFVWTADEELVLLEVVLVLIALILVATSIRATGPAEVGGRWYVRAVGYLAATVVLMFVALMLGFSYCESARGEASGNCGVPEATALTWAAGALGLCLVGVIVTELVLRRRNRASRVAPAHG